jgi:3',5'-cyclic-AMP phosphodiesterase
VTIDNAMRLAWITDPHLNHCTLAAWDALVGQVRSSGCDAVVISGDISEGEDVAFQLRRMADAFAVPIYFVLGNHDFYHSSFARTLQAVRAVTAADRRLFYLGDLAPCELAPGVAMIGEDGWGDASEGDYARSKVRLNDFRLIDDFRCTAPSLWRSILVDLGRQAAQRLQSKLAAALQTHAQVLVVTHVPPFREACWYQGKTTDDHWAPFFVCGQTGEALRQQAAEHRQATLEVICGHTHSGGVARIEANLNVTTAGADYGHPAVAGLIVAAERRLVLGPYQER